jgi:tRNA (guanine26-N2/guanine27-N2)-dimethyltransferase
LLIFPFFPSLGAGRKHGLVYICHFCQSHYEQPFGRVVEKTTAKGATMENFKFISGPPVGEKCPQCESAMTVSIDCWTAESVKSGR